MSEIDVCVVTYDSDATLAACLGSVQQVLPDSRVLIWDNSPDEGATERLRSLVPYGQTVTWHGDGVSNDGFGAACNSLARLATADTLLFLNPDAELLSWSSQPIAENELVGATVCDARGVLQVTSGIERTLWQEFAIRFLRFNGRGVDPISGATNFVSGAAMVIDRQGFLQIGGFDPTFFMYYEDIDLCHRWRQAGGAVTLAADLKVMHLGGHSAKKAHATALIRSFNSAYSYHLKWGRSVALFRAMCVVETLLKLTIAVPLGSVGQTSRRTLVTLLRHELFGEMPKRQRK